MVPTVQWHEGAVRLLDQSRLPETVAFLDCRDVDSVAQAIRDLKVRGAPAIGVTAALGIPFLWQSKAFSTTWKAILTVVVLAYTALIFWLFWLVILWSYHRIVNAL